MTAPLQFHAYPRDQGDTGRFTLVGKALPHVLETLE
jgi:hypothetical protein